MPNKHNFLSINTSCQVMWLIGNKNTTNPWSCSGFWSMPQGKMESTQHFDFSNCTSTIHDAVLISMRWTSMGPALCHVHLQILDSGAGSTLCCKHWLAYMTQGSRPDVASKVMQGNFKALFAHRIMSSSSTTLVVAERQVVAGAEIRDQAAYQKWSRAQRCLSAKDYQCWSCGQSGKNLPVFLCFNQLKWFII